MSASAKEHTKSYPRPMLTSCSLLIEEEDNDSAIESDSESSGARTKRQISRQFSRQFSRQSSLTTGRLRSDSHRASCYKHSELFDSTVSVTSAVTDMSIYVSISSIIFQCFSTGVLVERGGGGSVLLEAGGLIDFPQSLEVHS